MTDTPTEVTYDTLPDSVVSSVLDRWGYQEPSDTTVEPEPGEEQPEGQPEEHPEEYPAPPGGPIFTPDEEPSDEPAEPGPEEPELRADTAPAPQPAAQTPGDPLTQLLAERLGDEAFRNKLLELLLGQPPQPPAEPARQPLEGIPPITEDDLENPAVRASLLILNQQREQIAALQAQFADQQRQAEARNQAELSRIAESAVKAFQSSYNLPDDLIRKVRLAAGPMTMAAAQATGSQDPYTVMDKALELAYWSIPETRKFEFERQADARGKASVRRQKLGGVGGNSGSAPRTPAGPDLSTPEGRFDGAVAEATAAMFGTDNE